MTGRPYHHGDLRGALLAKAEETLRSSGAEALSLRELARAVGVSHAAPRRHFEDKADLLETLVADGFGRLGESLALAARADGRDVADRLRAVAVSFVGFAVDNPALVDLMQTNRYLAEATDELVAAREACFGCVNDLVADGQATGQLIAGDVRQTAMMLLATMQGIAVLANNKMLDALDGQAATDAVDLLLTGLTPRA